MTCCSTRWSLCAKTTEAHLVLAGAGAGGNRVENSLPRVGIRQSSLRRPRHQPCKYFAAATLFVLSSRHEGMPNALLEAAAAGLWQLRPRRVASMDLLHGRPGAWVATEITADALAVTIITALENVLRANVSVDLVLCIDSGVTQHESLERDAKSFRNNFSISSDANHRPNLVQSYFLTLFLIRCLLTIQFPYKFSTPRRRMPVRTIALLSSKGATQTKNDQACRAVS